MAEAKKTVEGSERAVYGVWPPIGSFENSISGITKIFENGGTAGTFDEVSLALDSEPTKGVFHKKLQAMKGFGLIQYEVAKRTYRLTVLAAKITEPISDAQRDAAIQSAFTTHPIVNKIWQTCAGTTIPEKAESFANYLGQAGIVEQKTKLEWAKYFLKAAEYAKIIQRRAAGLYVITSLFPLDATGKNIPNPQASQAKPKNIEETEGGQTEAYKNLTSSPFVDFSENLSSSDRRLLLQIPKRPTKDEASEILEILKDAIRSLRGYLIED